MNVPATPKGDYVPHFYLYGEPTRAVDQHFLHLETIKARSGPLRGRIKPHKHDSLTHLFVILKGAGSVYADDREILFDGPHILFIPTGIVHGFNFDAQVEGYVLTLADAFLKDLIATRTGIDGLGSRMRALPLKSRTEDVLHIIHRLEREQSWQAPAQRAAIEASLAVLLIDVYRLSQAERSASDLMPGNYRHVMARFHQQIEQYYKSGRTLPEYLSDLHVSEAQLRYACQKAGEASPMQHILNRRLIEAKRLLIYSDMSISDCALSLGFDDPAYFSRLFTRSTGQSPRAYRQAHHSMAHSPET
ncbi:MAG: helix-turn-helix domain-containing protein [Asticcacaulis sp.]